MSLGLKSFLIVCVFILFAQNKWHVVRGSYNESDSISEQEEYNYNDDYSDSYESDYSHLNTLDYTNSSDSNLQTELSTQLVKDLHKTCHNDESLNENEKFTCFLLNLLLRNQSFQLAMYGLILILIVSFLLLLTSTVFRLLNYKLINRSRTYNKVNLSIDKKEPIYHFSKVDGESNNSDI
jgi:hypothetical protein